MLMWRLQRMQKLVTKVLLRTLLQSVDCCFQYPLLALLLTSAFCLACECSLRIGTLFVSQVQEEFHFFGHESISSNTKDNEHKRARLQEYFSLTYRVTFALWCS